MITKLGLRDADLIEEIALPAAAGSVVTPAISIGPQTIFRGVRRPGEFEIAAEVPALAVGIIGDAETITLAIESATDEAFTAPVTLKSTVFTGAGGVGLPDGASVRTGINRTENQWIRAKATTGAGTGDASALKLTCALEF